MTRTIKYSLPASHSTSPKTSQHTNSKTTCTTWELLLVGTAIQHLNFWLVLKMQIDVIKSDCIWGAYETLQQTAAVLPGASLMLGLGPCFEQKMRFQWYKKR